MKKIFNYIDLRKKYNTLKNDYDTLLDTHEKDVREINKLKNKIKVLKSSNKEKSKKKSSSKTKSKSKSTKKTN